MAIKAGQILHVANQFVVDRIQTGGPGNLNIPQERVFELGNYQTVGIVRDIPELTFSLDCLDVGTEVEAVLCGSTTPSTDADHTKYELANFAPVDIISPWKSPYAGFDIVRGVVIPGLALESASYRYGLQENAGEQFSLRGDSIYYVPGTPWQDVSLGDGSTTAFAFDHGPALIYTEAGSSVYALSVMVDGERKTLGDDYTEDANGITFLVAPANGASVSITYGSSEAVTYTQDGNSPFGSGSNDPVHQGVSVKPAAIRGKDIDVYFSTLIQFGGEVTTTQITTNVATLTTTSAHGLTTGDVIVVAGCGATFDGTYTIASTPSGTTLTYAKTAADEGPTSITGNGGSIKKAVEVRWPDVQSATVDWKVNIEDDMEFGNYRAVARDYVDVPEVTGTVEVKPRSVEAMFNRLYQITGVDTTQIIGPQSSVTGALRIELRNPSTGGASSLDAGVPLKTLYVPDARFTLPGYEGQVQQKMTIPIEFQSDGGLFEVYKGTIS